MSIKKPVLIPVQHLLMSLVFILKGFDKFAHHRILGGLIFCFGLVTLGYFLYMIIKKKESATMHILIHLFEALACLFTAYIFYEEGKKYLQYGLLLASIGFFVSVYVYLKKHKRS